MSNGFINVGYKNTIESITGGYKDRLNNPFYIFNDKKPTVVTYFNLNTDKTTVDEGSEQIYELIGDRSPLRFNKIENAMLYGMDKILVDLDTGDFGLESSEIEGEAIVLPNTFIPYQNDYFSIDFLNKKKILFRVGKVTFDTIDNGYNLYKFTYKLDQYDAILDNQIVENFTMVVNNIGTNYNVIVKSEDIETINNLDSMLTRIKTYYKDLFFNKKVQTFTYMYNGDHFYDPYLVEFLIKNDILAGGGEYTHVAHAIYNYGTFNLDYDKTIFRYVELKDKNIKLRVAYASLIQDPSSLLSTRLEDYFKIDYGVKYNTLINEIPVVDDVLLERIINNKPYECIYEDKIYNIIINYFNDKSIRAEELVDILYKTNYIPSLKMFYTIPIIIYIVNNQIKQLLLKSNS